MADPWPEYIHQSFNSAIISDPGGRYVSVFYGPFNRLLNALFLFDGPYEIVPQFKSTGTRESIDFVIIILVEVNRHPFFFIEVKPTASFPYDSKRKEADEQMRNRFMELRQDLNIPILNGISAFGTRLSFYKYDSATQPKRIICSNSDILTDSDVAPLTWWDCDVLHPEGAERFRNAAKQVKEMCAQV